MLPIIIAALKRAYQKFITQIYNDSFIFYDEEKKQEFFTSGPQYWYKTNE